MKFWLTLKGYVRARIRKPASVPPTPAAYDLIGARIHAALRAAGAKTSEQIIAEMRKWHCAFLQANCPSTVYEFGMAGSAEHYSPAYELVWNASVLGYPAPDIHRSLRLRH